MDKSRQIEKGRLTSTPHYSIPQVALSLDKANITMQRHEDKIELKTDKLALFVTLDGEFVFSDNAFLMLPGETKTISFKKTLYSSSDEVQVFTIIH